MPVEAPEGTAARPAEPSLSVTSASRVGVPRESRISGAGPFRISLPMLLGCGPACSLGGPAAVAILLRHLHRLFHGLLRAGGADYLVGVVAVVGEVPRVQPHQRHAVDEGEGDLAQG